MSPFALGGPRDQPIVAALGGLVCLGTIVILGAGSSWTKGVSGPSDVEAAIAEAPLAFEPNAGRTDDRVDFIAHSVAGGSLYLTGREAVLSLPHARHEAR